MINIYIDSDVIVSSENRKEINHKESKNFMKFVIKNKNQEISFFTSVFTFLELASAIIRRKKNKDKAYSLLYRIRNTWKDSINPLPPIPPKKLTSFTRFIDTLIETSIKFYTPAGDTIHAHTVAGNEIDYLVTWNKKHFKRLEKKIATLKVVNPPEMLNILKEMTE